MKKLGCLIIICLIISSVVYANPIAVGDYKASIFTMFKSQIGEVGSFIVGLVFTILMVLIMIIIAIKALNIKKKPENKIKLIIVVCIIVALSALNIIGLVYTRETENRRGTVVLDTQKTRVTVYNSTWQIFEGTDQTPSVARNLIMHVKEHNVNQQAVDLYGEVFLIPQGITTSDISNRKKYKISIVEYYSGENLKIQPGTVKTIEIAEQ